MNNLATNNSTAKIATHLADGNVQNAKQGLKSAIENPAASDDNEATLNLSKSPDPAKRFASLKEAAKEKEASLSAETNNRIKELVSEIEEILGHIDEKASIEKLEETTAALPKTASKATEKSPLEETNEEVEQEMEEEETTAEEEEERSQSRTPTPSPPR